MTALHHNTYNNLRVMTPEGHEEYPVFSTTSQMYNSSFHCNMDPTFVPYHSFPPRTAHEQPYPGFGTAQLYDAPGYPQGSPSLHPHHHAGSPELQSGPFHSSLSSASGQSASSSNFGSPQSNHATLAHPVPQWPVQVQGLGIQPNIAGDYGYDFTFGGGSSMEQQHDIDYAQIQKPIGFVGECANVSASWSSQHPMSTSISMAPLAAQSNVIAPVTSSAMQQNGNQGMMPQPMSPPSIRRHSRTAFQVSDSSSVASHSYMAFSSRVQGRSPKSTGSQRAGSFSASSAAPPFKFPPPSSPFFSQSSGQYLPPFTVSCPDPAILQPYSAGPIASPIPQDFPNSVYPPPQSPAPSDMSSERSSKRIKYSQSPYLEANATFAYPYATASRPSMTPSSPGSASSLAKNHCPFPECGKAFKDLKAHMLTHQLERPEKCPIATCEYHTKGFARKYDKNRHTLTHYKGTMVCGFCPGSGSATEKSFNRADVFKRHLTSVHYVEQVPPNARRKTSGGSASSLSTSSSKGLNGYAPDATGKCSTCSAVFKNAQDFYEHLDDCVLRLVQQEEPSEAINVKRLREVEDDEDVKATLKANNLPTHTMKQTSFSDEEDAEFEIDDANDGDYSAGRKAKKSKTSKTSKKTKSAGGRKNKGPQPSSWGCPQEQMKMKKRTLCVFDGGRRMFKDEMMMDTDYQIRIPTGGEEPRTGGQQYVTDLDVQTMRRAEMTSVKIEQDWDQGCDIDALMKRE